MVRKLGVDFICLPLGQLDVILEMNQLKFNHVHTNCFDNIVMFLELGESKDLRFISANQVEMSLKQDAQVLMMFASLTIESEVAIVNLLIVCEFPYVFLDDIGDLPPDHEVKFAII